MRLPTIQRYGTQITTVDPTQGIVRGVFKGDAQERGFDIYLTPTAFRWPVVGEAWMVEQKNGTWYLDGLWPSTTAPTTYQDINPGDLVLNSPTGVVHVMGSDNGSSDFTMDDFPVRGSATLVSGTVTVTQPVTTHSLIFLTPQDNNTSGALRVSARTTTNFTITSSNGADHGLVAYQIWTGTS